VSVLANAQFIILTAAQSSLINDRACIKHFLDLLYFHHLFFVRKCNAISVRVENACLDIDVLLNVQLPFGVASIENPRGHFNFPS